MCHAKKKHTKKPHTQHNGLCLGITSKYLMCHKCDSYCPLRITDLDQQFSLTDEKSETPGWEICVRTQNYRSVPCHLPVLCGTGSMLILLCKL